SQNLISGSMRGSSFLFCAIVPYSGVFVTTRTQALCASLPKKSPAFLHSRRPVLTFLPFFAFILFSGIRLLPDFDKSTRKKVFSHAHRCPRPPHPAGASARMDPAFLPLPRASAAGLTNCCGIQMLDLDRAQILSIGNQAPGQCSLYALRYARTILDGAVNS